MKIIWKKKKYRKTEMKNNILHVKNYIRLTCNMEQKNSIINKLFFSLQAGSNHRPYAY